MNNQEKKYNLIKFEDGDFNLDVRVSPDEETVWLTLEQIGLLFERDKSVIGKYARNIINNIELEENSVKANFAYTASDGKTYYVDHYNLDMILAIGYRVNSKHGTQFRKWANSVCAENALTASDGKTYSVKYYNLDMIIAVDYRVNSTIEEYSVV